jgi:hypothetical protein
MEGPVELTGVNRSGGQVALAPSGGADDYSSPFSSSVLQPMSSDLHDLDNVVSPLIFNSACTTAYVS